MRFFVAIISCVALGACVNSLETDPEQVPVVPIDRVINSLKCGLARAVDSDKLGRSGIRHSTAVVKLDVNMTYGVDSSGKLSAGLPITGATLTPSFSFQTNEDKKYNTTIDFDIQLDKYDLAICNNKYSINYDAGFSIWLAQVVSSISEAASGPPYARLKKYVYTADFMVKKTVSGSVDAKIVIVNTNASASAAATTVDTHKLTVTIAAVHLNKDGKQEAGGILFDGKVDPKLLKVLRDLGLLH